MDGREGRPRLSRWLATSSVAALTAGGAAPPAYALICVNIGGAFTNSAAISCIAVSNTRFSGNISNAGTISPGGITLTAVSLTGAILDSGTISATGGNIAISIDSSTVLVATTGDAISITGPIFTGGISNAGTVQAGGTGIFIQGVTNFSGGIVNSGTISAAGKGLLAWGIGTFAGGISNAGTITSGSADGIEIGVNTGGGGIVTFSGGITNSGTISASAATGVLLSFVSTFSGGVVNSTGGTISAGNAGILVGAAGSFGGAVSTFLGGISNSGAISAGGAGLLAETVSDFDGGIANSGTISAGHGGIFVSKVTTFAGGISNSGSITASAVSANGIYVNAVSSFTGGVTNAGTISAGSQGIFISGASTFSGGIVNSGGVTGNVGMSIFTGVTFASGGGITNSGTISGSGGTAIDLSSASTAVLIDQQGGTINGAIKFSSHGDTLTGYGSLAGNLTTGNATIWPTLGGSGVLNLAGTYTQGSSGTLVIEVNPTTASKLAVSGAAALGGGLKIVYDPGTYSASTVYTVLTSSSLSGTFSSVSSDAGSAKTASQTVEYSPTSHTNDVVLTDVSIGSVTTNTGILGIGSNVFEDDNFGVTDTVFGHLNNVQMGEGGAAAETALAATQPIQLAFNGENLAQLGAMTQKLPEMAAQYGAWIRGIGSFLSVRGQGANPAYGANAGGFLAGIDRPVGANAMAGAAIGYSRSFLTQDDGSSGTIDTPRVMLYGSYRPADRVVIDGLVGFAYDRVHTRRPVAALSSFASESHNGFEESVAAQAGYEVPWRDYLVVPRVGLRYLHLSQTAFNESGAAGFDLTGPAVSTDSFQPNLSVTALTHWTTEEGLTLTPEFKIEYGRELLSTAQTLALTTPVGSLVPATPVTPARNVLTMGPMVTAHLSRRLDAYADYKLSLGLGKSTDHIVFAGLRWTF